MTYIVKELGSNDLRMDRNKVLKYLKYEPRDFCFANYMALRGSYEP